MLPRGMAQVIGHDQPYTSAELGNSSVQDAGFERHLNISIYDDSVFKEAYCAGDPGSQWGVESGYKGQRNVHFMGIQFANIKAKEYYPNFFGIAGWNGTGGGTNNDYRWVVDTIYEVVCNGKCHGEHNVEVTIGYDLTNDPDGIKDLFGELLHKDCPCENDHTVDWSQVNWNQEGTYNVKCNHPDKCPKLGTVKVVDIDFEIKLVPNDRNFPTRSYSRLGLQESGHIEVIPKGNDTPVKSEYTAIVDPGGTHLQIDASGDSVWNIPAHPNAVWIYDFNATFDSGVAKIKVTRTRNGVSKVKTYTVSIIQPNDINYSKDTSYGDQKNFNTNSTLWCRRKSEFIHSSQ
ncbi:MAG: hypothetical protein LBG80_12515 [Bacteroidales bacterium]|nr:hypothetical protein [Bacteroidales bacterium]